MRYTNPRLLYFTLYSATDRQVALLSQRGRALLRVSVDHYWSSISRRFYMSYDSTNSGQWLIQPGQGPIPSEIWHLTRLTIRLGHTTCKIVSEMTYNVSIGTLNSTIPYHPSISCDKQDSLTRSGLRGKRV